MSASATIEDIKVDDLIFDPQNPRLPEKCRGYNKDTEVLEWMIMNENLIDLMGSIGEKGYFKAEPLLVTKSLKYPKKWEVVEGNRRLAAVFLLRNPNRIKLRRAAIQETAADSNPNINLDTLPVIKFNKREDILIYLGYRHITGVKEWGPLAKAQYLEALAKNLKISNKEKEYKTLAKIIGSKPSYVKSILNGLQIFKIIEQNNFFDIPDLDEVSVEFGVLYTAINRPGISTFVGIDPNSNTPTKNVKVKQLRELTQWMFEKNSEGYSRLGESRNIPDLEKVIQNPDALVQFRKGAPLDEALLHTNQPIEVFSESVLEALKYCRIAVSKLPNLPADADIDTSDLTELKKQVDFLIKSVQ